MDSRSNALLLSLQALAQDKARRSIHTKHSLESTFQRDLALGNHSGDFLSSRADQPLFPSSRADEVGVAIHKGAKVDSSAKMDCHADFQSARNDRKNAASENAVSLEKVDSSANAKNVSEQPKDSRIFDEKCGLQGQSQRSYLSGNDCSDCPPLPHLSQKAESTSQKANTKPNKELL